MMITNILEKGGFERGLPVKAEIYTHVFRNVLMKMANGFTNIQCITALTLVFINDAQS